ncbi:hypothetical protein CK203_038583 [Vitis vinifera]|uniref:Uncharacterized protein n=1 Tax=Vitis vinifera TaxID=29760 RepID=A0A438I414_VITVI|nr:hypothetical protein CK203_091049 [Vitis vinifera]RVW91448.1 hypothetical protein CK203_038583 [Vitis vinifera]
MSTATPPKNCPSQLVVLNKAFKLKRMNPFGRIPQHGTNQHKIEALPCQPISARLDLPELVLPWCCYENHDSNNSWIEVLKYAEQWVKNMSTPLEDEPTEVKLEARPSRLGLGAKASRQSKIGPSNDPIERKLYAKLDAGKRKSSKSSKESTLSARNGSDNSDDSDEDLESRTKSFSKKRVVPPTSSLQRNKKPK